MTNPALWIALYLVIGLHMAKKGMTPGSPSRRQLEDLGAGKWFVLGFTAVVGPAIAAIIVCFTCVLLAVITSVNLTLRLLGVRDNDGR